MNNIFDINRFYNIVKRDLFENYRFLGVCVLFSFVLILLMNVSCLKSLQALIETTNGGNIKFVDSLMSATVVSFVFFFILVLMISGGTVFSSATKGDKLNYYILPASHLEKFFSRIVVRIVLALVVFFLGAVCGDLMRYALAPFFGVPMEYCGRASSVFYREIWEFFTYDDNNMKLTLFFYCVGSNVFSLFVLGSAYWNGKFGIVKTMIVMIIGGIILLFLGDNVDELIKNLCNLLDLSSNGKDYFILSLGFIISLVALFFAYRLFSRTTIVERKLFRLL